MIKSTFPFTRLMLLGLLLVTYVPAISLAPVEWLAGRRRQPLLSDGFGWRSGRGGSSKTTMADLMAAAGIDDDEDDLDDEELGDGRR